MNFKGIVAVALKTPEDELGEKVLSLALDQDPVLRRQAREATGYDTFNIDISVTVVADAETVQRVLKSLA